MEEIELIKFNDGIEIGYKKDYEHVYNKCEKINLYKSIKFYPTYIIIGDK